MKKLSMVGSLAILGVAVSNPPQAAAEVAKLPPSGTSHFTTYFSVRPAHELKMVDGSSISIVELVGITHNPDGEPYFDKSGGSVLGQHPGYQGPAGLVWRVSRDRSGRRLYLDNLR